MGRVRASCRSTVSSRRLARTWARSRRHRGRVNAYGQRARDYMALHQPEALAAIEDQDSYFSDLGERILAQVLELTESLAGPARPEEGYVERTGRLRMARQMAEEKVLGELVFSSWEEPEGEPQTDETGAWIGGPPGWEPMIPPDPQEDDAL